MISPKVGDRVEDVGGQPKLHLRGTTTRVTAKKIWIRWDRLNKETRHDIEYRSILNRVS